MIFGMKRALFISLFLTCCVFGQEKPLNLSLEQCVGIALENNPSVGIAQEQLVFQKANLKKALSNFFPKWTSSWKQTQSTTPTVSNIDNTSLLVAQSRTFTTGLTASLPTNTDIFASYTGQKNQTNSNNSAIPINYFSTIELGFRQPLLKGMDWMGNLMGSLWVDRLIAKAQKESSNFTLKDTLNAQVSQLEQSYYALVGAQERLQARKEALDLTQEQKNIVFEKVKAGLVVETELIQVEERLSSRELDVLIADQEYERIKTEVIQLLGIGHQNPIAQAKWQVSQPKKFPNLGVTKEQLETQIEAQNYELLSQKKLLLASEKNMNVLKTSQLPSLNFEGSYFFLGGNTVGSQGFDADIDELFNDRSDAWNLGLTLEVPLGVSPDRQNYKMAKSQFLQKKHELRRIKNQIYFEAQRNLQKVNQGRQLIPSARKTLELAAKKLDFEKRKFRSGLTTAFTVLTYQTDLTDARIKAVNVGVDYLSAVSQLEYLLGRTLDKYRVNAK